MVTTRADFWSATTARARRFKSPLRDFLRTESGGAAVLLAATVAALVWVNVDAVFLAPVTVVEYGDFECPYRGRAEPEVRELLRDSRVSGTPTFFINGRRHHGAYDIDTLSRAVRAAGARAKLAAS